MECYLYGVCGSWLHVYGHIDLLTEHTQLLHGCRAEGVTRCQQWLAVAFVAQKLCKLAAHCGFSRTVEACHHDDCGPSVEVDVLCLAAHEVGQLVVNKLNHQLSGLNGGDDIHAQRFLFHRIGECLGHIIVDIGVKKSAANVFQRFCHIDFGYLSFAFEYFE